MAHELNIGTIGGLGVEEILNMMVSKKIGIDIGSTGVYVPSYSFIDGAIAVGSVVTMNGYEWVIADIDGANNALYMLTKDIISTTQFGSSTAYSGSTLASVAKAFENNLSEEVLNNLLTTTILGVSQKVQAPTYDQMNGGFSLFTDASARVANYNGTATAYWTASPSSGSVYCVNTGGGLSNGGPSGTTGFRPCVALAM